MNKERVATLRKRVAKDPYDAASWESLVSEADRARRGSERNAELTAVYEDLLSKFPTAVRTPPPPLPAPACCLPPLCLCRHCLTLSAP
jgi:hypothetical protein